MKKFNLLLTFLVIAVTCNAASVHLPAEPIVQQWKLAFVVVDGVETVPGITMVDDILYINEDHTAVTILSGVELNGTWTIDPSNSWITFSAASLDRSIRLNILELSATTLKVQQLNSEGAATIMIFQPE